MNPLAEQMLNACAETVLAVDPETLAIIAANQQAEILLGYPQSDLIGRPIADIEVGLQDLFFWEEFKKGNKQSCPGVEGEYRHRSGQLITVQKTVRLIEVNGSQFFVISVHDITTAKQLEEKAACSHSLMAATLESMGDGILVTNLSGKICHFNHHFAEILQLPLDILSGTDESKILDHILHQLKDPDTFRRWFENLFSQMHADGSSQCQLTDGRVFSVSSRPQCLRERPIGRVFSFHDITSLKAIEEQLFAARHAAEATNQAKSEFLSHMSHELRTPLNAILGFSQLLEETLQGQNKTVAGHISKAGQHLLDLINDVLDLSSIEVGKVRLDMRPVDLSETIRDSVAMVSPLAESRDIALHIKPIAAQQFMVNADARRLKQMVINLLSNAIKYNQKKGRVEIAVTAQEDKEQWRISIVDTGAGIAEEDYSQLFQPFSHIAHNNPDTESTGIGLAITHKLAQLMHGTVGVESQLGVGSHFWIDLPCADVSAAAPVPPLHAAPLPNTTPATLLYIEDNVLSQKLLMAMLSRKRPNYRLMIATTATEGRARARMSKPDLILLDLQLPDEDGTALLQALRTMPETQDIPVIALSGHAKPEDIQSGIKAGFKAYLTKPLQIDATLASIDRILTQRSTT